MTRGLVVLGQRLKPQTVRAYCTSKDREVRGFRGGVCVGSGLLEFQALVSCDTAARPCSHKQGLDTENAGAARLPVIDIERKLTGVSETERKHQFNTSVKGFEPWASL